MKQESEFIVIDTSGAGFAFQIYKLNPEKSEGNPYLVYDNFSPVHIYKSREAAERAIACIPIMDVKTMNSMYRAVVNHPTGSEIEAKLEEERIIVRATVNEAVTLMIRAMVDSADAINADILKKLAEARER